ncbi:hypothetical protein AB0L65_55475 [Nonomuraea sp. NPDC052116]|uniref:hypothetical protein n=1 Tax=Nonomuraea sp. NPDC052116 TaxID=3155665 RepID=UPI003445F963
MPHDLTLESYRTIFTNSRIVHSLLVSVVVALAGTAVSMVVTVLCAYGLSRPRSFGHRTILMALVVTMFFGGGMIPTSRVVVAVITLFYAVGYWNSFFDALLYLPDNGKWPLQMIIYTYTLQGNFIPGPGSPTGSIWDSRRLLRCRCRWRW